MVKIYSMYKRDHFGRVGVHERWRVGGRGLNGVAMGFMFQTDTNPFYL